jgi:hypothetical protein
VKVRNGAQQWVISEPTAFVCKEGELCDYTITMQAVKSSVTQTGNPLPQAEEGIKKKY